MSYKKNNERVPVMQVGRYSGKPVDQLPNSYLRWVIGQDFPKIILEAAKKKLEGSDYNDLYMDVSRHAIDMFSKRFINLWVQSEAHKGEEATGIASFLATMAHDAWGAGRDVSKHRHQDDGIVKVYRDIQWVFGINPNFPDYRNLITVMDINEK